MIRFRFLKGVKDDVAAECRRLAYGFKVVSRAGHPISVTVVPAPTVIDPDGNVAFGACCIPGKRDDRVRIYVGAELADICQEKGESRAEGVRSVGHTLLHELAHYEQYRDGRPLSERGVNRRATGLYAKIDSAMMPKSPP